MRKVLILFIAILSLFGSRAMAQRNLPGTLAIEIRGGMVDGFYTPHSRNSGYSMGVFYSKLTESSNAWVLGGEYQLTYNPYAEKGRIPIAQFTGEAGYSLHLLSDYSQTFNVRGGISALGGYETINWGQHSLRDGSKIKNHDAFIYGAAVTLQADIFLTDNLAIGTFLKERVIFGNSTGHFLFQYGVNLKYQF